MTISMKPCASIRAGRIGGTTKPGWPTSVRTDTRKLSVLLRKSTFNRPIHGRNSMVCRFFFPRTDISGATNRWLPIGRRSTKVLADRNEGEPNQLLTQKYFVFKNEADIERLLGGLSKAGLPELPADVNLDPNDRLTGAEIKFLVLGHELRGRNTAPDIEPYRRGVTADGSITVTFGSRTRTGKTWVQGNFLCSAYPKALTSCGAVFRNPSGTREQENEYRSIYPYKQCRVLGREMIQNCLSQIARWCRWTTLPTSDRKLG